MNQYSPHHSLTECDIEKNRLLHKKISGLVDNPAFQDIKLWLEMAFI
jgi:hypothetical protein